MSVLGSIGNRIKSIASGAGNVAKHSVQDIGRNLIQGQLGVLGDPISRKIGLDRSYNQSRSTSRGTASIPSEGDGAYGGQSAPVITGKAATVGRSQLELSSTAKVMGDRVTGAIDDLNNELRKLSRRAGGEGGSGEGAGSHSGAAHNPSSTGTSGLPNPPHRPKGRSAKERSEARKKRAKERAEERRKRAEERKAKRENRPAAEEKKPVVEDKKPSLKDRAKSIGKGIAEDGGKALDRVGKTLTGPLHLAGKAFDVYQAYEIAKDFKEGTGRSEEEYGNDSLYSKAEAGGAQALAGVLNMVPDTVNTVGGWLGYNPGLTRVDPRHIADIDKNVTNSLLGSYSPFAQKKSGAKMQGGVIEAKKIIFEATKTITFKARSFDGLSGLGSGGSSGEGFSVIGGSGGSSGSGASGTRRMPPSIRYNRQHTGRTAPGYNSKGYGHNTPAESKWDLKNPTNKKTDLNNSATNDLVAGVYDAYRRTGFSHEAAKTMAAEVGRENSFNPNILFGSHKDPYNNKTNAGMLSWQGDRGDGVMDQLRQKGLLNPDGSIKHTQAAIDAMAAFSAQEMEKRNPKLAAKMKDPSLSYGDLQHEVGKDYVQWRIDDPKYSGPGMKNQNNFYDRVSGLTDQRDVGTTPKNDGPSGVTPAGGSTVFSSPNVVENQGKVAEKRRLPIQDNLKNQLAYAADKNGVQVEIFSGGQASDGPMRTGSHRHDNGGAADLYLYKMMPDGSRRKLDMRNPEDAKIMKGFTADAIRAGATGVGAAVDYMGPSGIHIGGGSAAVWGPGGTGTPDPFIAEAFKQGMAGQRDGSGARDFDAWKQEQQKKQLAGKGQDNSPVTAIDPASKAASLFAPGNTPSNIKPGMGLGAMAKAMQDASNSPTSANKPYNLFDGDSSKWKVGPGAETGRLQPGTAIGKFNDKGGFDDGSKAIFRDYIRDDAGKVIGITADAVGSKTETSKEYYFGKGGGPTSANAFHAIKDTDSTYIGGTNNPMNGNVAGATSDLPTVDAPGRVVDRANSLAGSDDKKAAKALDKKMTFGEWCADFVNGVLDKEHIKGTGSAMSDSFMKWGVHVEKDDVHKGDIIVETGKTDTGEKLGHVGIANGKVQRDEHGNIVRYGMVSGNHDDHVIKDYWEDRSRVTELRRASTKELEPVQPPAPQAQAQNDKDDLSPREKREDAAKVNKKKHKKGHDDKDRSYDKQQGVGPNKVASAGRVKFDDQQHTASTEFA